mmetsp:Transcript_79914/g.226019  ORF Transcript_79914/g.226019 Transcript_79914/m.226019 type:complete len:243 (+) Transcript_79914:23-751(+)
MESQGGQAFLPPSQRADMGLLRLHPVVFKVGDGGAAVPCGEARSGWLQITSLWRQLVGVTGHPLVGAAGAEIRVRVRALAVQALLRAVLAPVCHVARELVAPGAAPDEEQRHIQAQRAEQRQSLAPLPGRVGSKLLVNCVLLVNDENPHEHKLQDPNHVVQVLRHRVVLSLPDQRLQADEHERQGHKKAICELHRLMPHDQQEHHTVVDQQRPPEPIRVREARKDRKCQGPRGDLKGAHNCD